MAKESEADRLYRMTALERPFWERGIALAGMDEAGRGPLAGPVVAACIILPSQPLIEGVNDSKKLSEAKRERLYELLIENALSYGIGIADEREIDGINILQATKLAMRRAYEAMEIKPADILIDAVSGLAVAANQHPYIKGDALSYLVAAASILAKVTRDRFMRECDALYPAYGFWQHKGYGTAAHIEAIARCGPCELHRRTFIKKFIVENEGDAYGAQPKAWRDGRSAGGSIFAEEGV